MTIFNLQNNSELTGIIMKTFAVTIRCPNTAYGSLEASAYDNYHNYNKNDNKNKGLAYKRANNY